MVSLTVLQQSNEQIGGLATSLVAVFIGATSGIAQQALKLFAQHARAPRVYSVARPASSAAHKKLLAELQQAHPDGSFELITADFTLVAEIGKVAEAVRGKESKVDFLFLSTGFIAFEGRFNTTEGLDPSMTTRYYSRVRAVQLLLPLLNKARSPRIMYVLAGGMEKPLNEEDLDLREPGAWTFWTSSLHSTTMSTLVLEKFAKENPRLSVVHFYPGPVQTPGFDRVRNSGNPAMANLPDPASVEESGEQVLFMATSDMFAVQGGGVPVPEGHEVAPRSGGGIFITKPGCEPAKESETVLAEMRGRGVADNVWRLTEKVFADCIAQN